MLKTDIKVYQSVRIIDRLRLLYPGKWEQRGKYWDGPDFTVQKDEHGRYYRVDTGETIALPSVKKRSHFIHKVLEERLGGTWTRCKNKLRWKSEAHPFSVYRSSGIFDGRARAAYRRSDTGEVVYHSNGRKF